MSKNKTTNDLLDEISKETGWPVDIGLTEQVDALLDEALGDANRPDSYEKEVLSPELFRQVKETVCKLFQM